MSTIGPALPPSSVTPSYSPLGKPTVGLETPDAKNQALPPVEQSARPDKNRSQPNSQTDPLATDADRRKGRERETSSDDGDEGHADAQESAGGMVEARAHEAATGAASPAGSPGFRFIAGAARPLEKPSDAAEAANAFKAAETGTAPGSLLDQLI